MIERRQDIVGRIGRVRPVGALTKGICAGASAAMRHARNHEQSIELARLLRATHRLGYGLVVVDVAQRRDLAVRPSDILDQLAALLLEGPQIRIDRTEDRSGASLRLTSEFFYAERVRGPP